MKTRKQEASLSAGHVLALEFYISKKKPSAPMIQTNLNETWKDKKKGYTKKKNVTKKTQHIKPIH